MLCSKRTLAAILAVVLPSGCFIDGGGSNGDSGATSGETADATGASSTGTEISAGPTTQSTTGTSAAGSSSSSTQGTTVDESDTTTAIQTSTDTDSDSDSDTDTDSDTEGSSTTDDSTLSVDDLEPGDLIITEVMANPNCTGDNCEWFEVYNATEFDIDLQNLGIGDTTDYDNSTPGTLILASAILPAGELGVLAREELWPYNESVEPLARYSNAVRLSNSTFERVAIFAGNEALDVTASFLPNEEPGRSRVLMGDSWDQLNHTDSDDWCWSNTDLPSTSTSDDWGTPGTDLIDCLPPS